MAGLRRLALSLALIVAGCSAPIDLKEAMQVSDVSTGWYDAGIVGGKNKLVPSVTFRLKKGPETSIPALSLNVVFKAVADGEGWDDVFVQRVNFVDGVQTAPITVRPEKGYTGDAPQTRLQILQHSGFRDLNVQVFGKQSSSQWTEVYHTQISRQLITQ
jgi:hypothetical protein